MICKHCHCEHQSCTDLQNEIVELRRWKTDALTSLDDWSNLGVLLTQIFPLRVGDNIPRCLNTQITATMIVLRKMLNWR